MGRSGRLAARRLGRRQGSRRSAACCGRRAGRGPPLRLSRSLSDKRGKTAKPSFHEGVRQASPGARRTARPRIREDDRLDRQVPDSGSRGAYLGAANTSRGNDRTFSSAETREGRSRLLRPDREDRGHARRYRCSLGALQARWRHRPRLDRRGAGYEPRAMERDRETHGGILCGARRARRPRTYDFRSRRREAIDLQFSGC